MTTMTIGEKQIVQKLFDKWVQSEMSFFLETNCPLKSLRDEFVGEAREFSVSIGLDIKDDVLNEWIRAQIQKDKDHYYAGQARAIYGDK